MAVNKYGKQSYMYKSYTLLIAKFVEEEGFVILSTTNLFLYFCRMLSYIYAGK